MPPDCGRLVVAVGAGHVDDVRVGRVGLDHVVVEALRRRSSRGCCPDRSSDRLWAGAVQARPPSSLLHRRARVVGVALVEVVEARVERRVAAPAGCEMPEREAGAAGRGTCRAAGCPWRWPGLAAVGGPVDAVAPERRPQDVGFERVHHQVGRAVDLAGRALEQRPRRRRRSWTPRSPYGCELGGVVAADAAAAAQGGDVEVVGVRRVDDDVGDRLPAKKLPETWFQVTPPSVDR